MENDSCSLQKYWYTDRRPRVGANYNQNNPTTTAIITITITKSSGVLLFPSSATCSSKPRIHDDASHATSGRMGHVPCCSARDTRLATSSPNDATSALSTQARPTASSSAIDNLHLHLCTCRLATSLPLPLSLSQRCLRFASHLSIAPIPSSHRISPITTHSARTHKAQPCLPSVHDIFARTAQTVPNSFFYFCAALQLLHPHDTTVIVAAPNCCAPRSLTTQLAI